MNRMSDGGRVMASKLSQAGSTVQRMQQGGVVNQRTMVPGAEGTGQEITMVNVSDPTDVMRVLGSKRGEQAIINMVARNAKRGGIIRKVILEGT